MVSIGKVPFSAKRLFGRIGGLTFFFFEKKNGCRIQKFSHFLCQKTTFFFDFGTPLFSGRRPEKKSVFWYIFFAITPKNITKWPCWGPLGPRPQTGGWCPPSPRGPRPQTRGVPSQFQERRRLGGCPPPSPLRLPPTPQAKGCALKIPQQD